MATQPAFSALGNSYNLIRLSLGGILLLAVSACAVAKNDSIQKDCVLPTDQLGTLLGKWRTTPIPIAFSQSSGFSGYEMSQITAAADTWNTFYAASIGMNATIDYGTAASPRTSAVPRPTTGLCASGIVSGNGYSGQIVLYKNGSWPFPSSPNAMALTSHCRSAGTPLPIYYTAIIDFNYQNFFVSGKRVPDLQTIILHEFGHVVGLNHSCEAAGSPGMPTCGSPGLNPDYSTALMFPSFAFGPDGNGEQKRSLASNDQGRANCLYMNLSK